MKLKQWMNLAAFAAVLAVNSLANILQFNGQTTGGVSDSIPSLFTPAGYVFSIWGLIYLLLGAFCVYQIIPAQGNAAFIKQVGWWFVISSVFNISWLFVWHYNQFLLSEVMMIGLLVSLLVIYQRLNIGRSKVKLEEKLLVHVPFSTYLAWICIATIANTSVLLSVAGWNGFGIAPEIWTALMLVIGGALGVLMIFLRREVAFPLVVIWAFLGVVVRRADLPLVAVTAGVMAAVVLVALIVSLLRKRPEAV